MAKENFRLQYDQTDHFFCLQPTMEALYMQPCSKLKQRTFQFNLLGKNCLKLQHSSDVAKQLELESSK